MANITRDIFRKACNYAYGIFQKGKTVLDTDINDARQIQFHQMKDLVDITGISGFLNLGFKIVESTHPENNFNVLAGYGYSEGLRLYQDSNSDLIPDSYPDPPVQSHVNLCSVISSVTELTFTDLRLNLIGGAEAGKEVVVFGVGVDNKKTYTIQNNTTNTFTFTGVDLVSDGVTEFKAYTIKPTTPVNPRVDAVLLNIFLDEIIAEEDNILYHNLGGSYTNEIRKKIRNVIYIVEDVDPILYTVPADYTDLRGNSHHYEWIGYIDRGPGVADITNITLTDSRSALNQLGDYVLKAGDTMTGNLLMAGADIELDSGGITLTSGDATLTSGGINLNSGDLRLTGGNIDMGSGQISGSSSGKIYFDSYDGFNSVTNFASLGGTELHLENSSGDVLGRIVFNETEFAFYKAHSTNLINASIASPINSYHATPKVWVEALVHSHTHSQYLRAQDLGRKTINSIEGLAGLTGHDWTAGSTITWTHNLNDTFVNVFLQTYDGSNWVQVDGSYFEIKMVDANNISILNNTAVSILDIEARICTIKAHNTSSIVVNDMINGLTDDSQIIRI